MRWLCVLGLLGCATAPRTTPQEPAAAADNDKVPFGPDERADELRFLVGVLRDTYSHLETKKQQWGVDLDDLLKQYEPLIRRADTWDRYERVMVAFVSEFHDAHLAWRRKRAATEKKRRIVRLGLSTRFIGDQLIVDDVWAGSGAERAGVKIGDHIVGMDGDTVEQRMGGLTSLRSWSRVEDGRYDFAEEWPAQRVDMDAPVPWRRVTRERADGSYESLRIEPETRRLPQAPRKENVAFERQGGVGLLRVGSLGGSMTALEKKLDEFARDIFADPQGLVVDLRGNNGGYDKGARIVAARLCNKKVEGATIRVRLSPRARQRSEWKDLPEDPAMPGWSVAQPVAVDPLAPKAYPARIAVVVDAGCRSSCEALALLLRAMGARLFGERTGGSSGAPLSLLLPRSGARVTVPAWAMFDPSGQPIEGRGVAPDEDIAPSREDLIARRDPALLRALGWAGGH